MTKDTRKALRADLFALTEKYDMEHAAFCATYKEDGEFYGGMISNGDRVLKRHIFPTIFNIGRLWQYARESARDVLNSFEKSENP